MNRCKIKPAYSRSPAERVHEWVVGNSIRVLATAIACVIVWFLVNHVLVGIFNILGEAAAWDNENAEKFSGTSKIIAAIKIVSCSLCAWFLLFRFRFKK